MSTSTTLPNFSLRNKFNKLDTDGNPVAEFYNKLDFREAQIKLVEQQASFMVKERKKTKKNSGGWVVTLTSPLAALT